MKPILRLFFVGTIAGLLSLFALRAHAQSATDSFDRNDEGAFQQESPDSSSLNGDTNTPAPFPPLAGQTDPGSAVDEGMKEDQDDGGGDSLADMGDQEPGQNDGDLNNSGSDAGASDSGNPR